MRFPLSILLIGVLAAGSACNDASLVSGHSGGGPSNPSNPDNPGSDDPNDPGIDGGHFDLDTSSHVYVADHGTTDHHVHRYDDIYDVTSVDFFQMLDAGFTEISQNVAPGEQFIVIVGNAQLSPLSHLEINGVSTDVTDYQQKVIDYRNGAPSLDTFTLSAANPLNSFRIAIDPNAILAHGLVSTQTGCVRSNKSGAHGEYRDGALVIQILDKATAVIDPATNTAAANGGLLWEATLFWHEPGGTCF